MPFTATVHRIMIASPGDVQPERNIVREVVDEWNSVHGARRGMFLLAVGWETDVAPEMGDEPQRIINKRILGDADLLVGIFWTRLGTPTSEYASGAVEEIEKHLAAGKPAMLYFSSAPVALDSVDPDQYRGLKAFKDSCRSRGVYEIYNSIDEFRRDFSRQLHITLNADGFAATAPAPTPPITNAALSEDAARLLTAAVEEGAIYRLMFGGGTEIQANGEVFNEDMHPRTIARWEGAIEELEKQGFVKAGSEKREVFEVTHRGFSTADTLPKELR